MRLHPPGRFRASIASPSEIWSTRRSRSAAVNPIARRASSAWVSMSPVVTDRLEVLDVGIPGLDGAQRSHLRADAEEVCDGRIEVERQ